MLQDALSYQRQQFTLLNWEVVPLTERKWLRALALRFEPCPLYCKLYDAEQAIKFFPPQASHL